MGAAPVTSLVPTQLAASMQTNTQATNAVATVNVTEKEWSITPTRPPLRTATSRSWSTTRPDRPQAQIIKSTVDPKKLPESKVHGEIDEVAVGDKAGEIEGIPG